jgi:hypothetical protein
MSDRVLSSEFFVEEESSSTCEDLKCDWKAMFLCNIKCRNGDSVVLNLVKRDCNQGGNKSNHPN